MRPGHSVCRPVVLLVLGVSLLLSGCGSSSQSDLDKAKASGASEEAAKQKDALQQQAQDKLAAEVKKLKEAAAKAKKQAANPDSSAAKKVAPAPQGSSCGGNLSVGPSTSCAFAANVEAAFYSAGGGTNTVEVYSPVTATYYTMSCVAGVPSVCRGGNNAVVYIR